MNATPWFVRSVRVTCFIGALLGCGDDSGPRGDPAGQDADSPVLDAAIMPAERGSSEDDDVPESDGSASDDGGLETDDAGHEEDGGGSASDPCADVDCSGEADECNTAACDPDTGSCVRTPKPDGTACGDGTDTACDAADACRAGVCEQKHAAAGTSCGNSAETSCDHADTCDGSGTCQTNVEPAGTTCGDATDTPCDNPDSCDGAGSCRANVEPSGTACGDATATDCDAADTCDGAGACVSNRAAAGAPCGDRADTACTDPDTCDGSGVCRQHHSSSGTPCGDQNVPCHLNDACNGLGVCLDAGLLPEGTACGDARNDECRNPDLCDAAGLCQRNDESVGTSCGSCPAGAACECRGAACVDTCSAFGVAEYGYVGCSQTASAPPCLNISSTGAALSLAPGASASVDIGFDFTLYGVTRRAVHIHEDGLLSFGSGAALPSAPECLTAGVLNTTSGPAIAPFWTDFASGGSVYYQTSGAAPDRTFSVQWTADHVATGANAPADIRVELSEAGQRVRVCYVDTTFGGAADRGALAVAGVMDAAGIDALELSCKTPDLPDATTADYYCVDGCPFTTTSGFDELQAGDLLAAKSSDWSAWNNDPSVDSTIVASPFHSAPSSLRITATKDLVRLFDAGTGGVVVLSALSYVPSDIAGIARFIVEDAYYPSGFQHWLTSVSLDATTQLVTDDGGSEPQTGGARPSTPVALVRDAWAEIRVTIDLGARTYSSTYNGQALVTGRTWSLGASGSLRGAINLYGDVTLTGAAYFDDVTIAKLPSAVCGNGVVEPGEACDLGAQNSNAIGSRCDSNCHSSLVAWLDGADPNGDGSPRTDGAAVAVWVDKAGRADASQADPEKQPVYVANGLGSGALAFDGLNDFLALPIDINPSALPSLTVVAVFQNAPGHPSELAGVWGHDDYGWDRFMVSGGTRDSGGGWSGVSFGDGMALSADLTTESVPLIAIATLTNGGPSALHVNGRLGASFTENRPGTGTASMSIGSLDGPSFPPFPEHSFDGLIAEFMVFDRALTPAARNRLGSALAAKYGVVSYCGDGVTGAGEQCDDGINLGVACSPTCALP